MYLTTMLLMLYHGLIPILYGVLEVKSVTEGLLFAYDVLLMFRFLIVI